MLTAESITSAPIYNHYSCRLNATVWSINPQTLRVIETAKKALMSLLNLDGGGGVRT